MNIAGKKLVSSVCLHVCLFVCLSVSPVVCLFGSPVVCSFVFICLAHQLLAYLSFSLLRVNV